MKMSESAHHTAVDPHATRATRAWAASARRRLAAGLAAALLLGVAPLAQPMVAAAATVNESEPNNSADTADAPEARRHDEGFALRPG